MDIFQLFTKVTTLCRQEKSIRMVVRGRRVPSRYNCYLKPISHDTFTILYL